MTIPGIFAGNWRTTSKIASVPPVEAPIAIRSTFPKLEGDRRGAELIVSEELAEALGVPTPPRALLETEDTAPPRDAAEPAKAPGEGRRTLAFAPTTSLDLRVCRKACFPPSRFISGLRTKSTAPAARASNTRTFREDTKIMGMGLVGRTSRRKSNPVIPGISMSRVIMSGFSWGSLFLASMALMAYPTTSKRGSAPKFCTIQLLNRMESSTIIRRIFDMVIYPPFAPSYLDAFR